MLVDQYHIVIVGEKLSGYLLNAQHPDGWAKAKFFFATWFYNGRRPNNVINVFYLEL